MPRRKCFRPKVGRGMPGGQKEIGEEVWERRVSSMVVVAHAKVRAWGGSLRGSICLRHRGLEKPGRCW